MKAIYFVRCSNCGQTLSPIHLVTQCLCDATLTTVLDNRHRVIVSSEKEFEVFKWVGANAIKTDQYHDISSSTLRYVFSFVSNMVWDVENKRDYRDHPMVNPKCCADIEKFIEEQEYLKSKV